MFKSFDDLPEELRDELLARHHHHGKDDPECKEDGIFYTEQDVIEIINAVVKNIGGRLSVGVHL